jgi:hypothetical protein
MMHGLANFKSLPSAEIERAIPAIEQPQTDALECAANGISIHTMYIYISFRYLFGMNSEIYYLHIEKKTMQS